MANLFPDGASVQTPFPVTAEQQAGEREAWPWLRGEVVSQIGPDEWEILVTAAEVAETDEHGEETHPIVFRDATEIRRPSTTR